MDQGDDDDWVPYRLRPEWKDVEPIAQAEFGVICIAYTDKFRDIYDYFRAVIKKNELSLRAFYLTADAVDQNPANYTVWEYRRRILSELKLDLYNELDFIGYKIQVHPKNYQVWYHRQEIVSSLNDPTQEIKFIDEILREDAKNYHAWQYRQWILTTYKLFDGELNYVNYLLEDDLRNNSAWNHRYFILNHTTSFHESTINSEIDYALNAIKKAYVNESSWNYLRGILEQSENGLNHWKVVEFCNSSYISGNRSPQLLSFLLDVNSEILLSSTEENKELFIKTLQLCDLLCKEDPIRRLYWNFIATELQNKYKNKFN